MSPDDTIRLLGQDLLACCLVQQGRQKEVFSRLQPGAGASADPQSQLILGQVHARTENWDRAADAWLSASETLQPETVTGGHAATLLLTAAVELSKRGAWIPSYRCLMAAMRLDPRNPLLKAFPDELLTHRPTLMFVSGPPPAAISQWERQLRENGYTPALVHSLAIAHQSMLESTEPMAAAERLAHLERAYCYWTALGHDAGYWQNLFHRRCWVYGDGIAQEDFVRTVSRLGVQRCHARLPELRRQWEQPDAAADGAAEALALLADVQRRLALERHTADLLARIRTERCLNWPPGGTALLALLWGRDRRDEALAGVGDTAIGSPGWLLDGLGRDGSQEAFLGFLNKDYGASIQLAEESDDPALANLKGLALIRKAENAMETQTFEGCREMAANIDGIPDPLLRHRAAELLEELTGRRVKTFLARGAQDEAISFLEEVIRPGRGFKPGRTALPKTRDALASTYLQRSERLYLAGDIDGFIRDLKSASLIVTDKALCDNHLKKIVRHQIIDRINNKKYREAKDFVWKMEQQFSSPFLTAMAKLCEAWRLLNDSVPPADERVFQLLHAAYQRVSDEPEIAKLYSLALSNRAVEALNKAATAVPMDVSRVMSALNKAREKLQKAMHIDANNTHAQQNLLQVIQQTLELKMKLGMQ